MECSYCVGRFQSGATGTLAQCRVGLPFNKSRMQGSELLPLRSWVLEGVAALHLNGVSLGDVSSDRLLSGRGFHV